MMPFVGSGRFYDGAGGPPPSTPYYVELTIDAGRVSADLTDFPVYVDLSLMPDGFWANVKSDGGDIRVTTTGGTVIPHDMVWINKTDEQGELYFLASAIAAASDNSWIIACGNSSASKLAATDPNGRNAVWTNFERFYNFYETADRTGSGVSASVTGEGESWVRTKHWPMYNIHQGIAVDGEFLILIDTDFLIKITREGQIVRHYTGTLSAAGLSGGHLGDGCVIGSYLYLGGVNSAGTASYLVRFNKDTLAYVDKFDISAEAAGSAASLAFNPADGQVYRLVYGTTIATLHGYNPTTGSHLGNITLSVGVSNANGLTFHDGAIYIFETKISSPSVIHRYALSGTYDKRIYEIGRGDGEGLASDGDGLLFTVYNGAGEGVYRIEPTAEVHPSALSFDGAGYADIVVPKLTTWTLGATVDPQHRQDNQYYITYGGGGAGEILGLDGTASDPNGIGLFNSTDSWVYVPAAYKIGEWMPFAAYHDGTTERKVFMFGRSTTDAGVASLPAGTGTSIRLGDELSGGSPLFGPINEFFLYDGSLSDAWHEAWYNNRSRHHWFARLLDDDGSVVYPWQVGLTNPGAEAGAMTGWSQINSSGLGTAATGVTAHTGSYRFVISATVATPWWGQTVSLPAEVLTDVDAGVLDVELAAYFNTLSTDADMGQLVVDCYDGSSNWLSGTQSPWYECDQSERLTLRTIVPPGTRSVRLSVRGWRLTGTECSVYIDDFELYLLRSNDRSENAVVTSMELGSTTGWTNTTGSLGTSAGFSWGETCINGGSNAATVGYKEFTLPAGLSSEIAAGDVSLHFFGSIGNINGDDTINVQLQFVDGSNALIGTAVKLSNNTSHLNPGHRTPDGSAGGTVTVFHPVYMREAVPTNAAKVRVTLSYARVDGTVLDAGICRMAMLATVDL